MNATTANKKTTPTIIIKLNDCKSEITCPICGDRKYPQTGAWFFTVNPARPVCRECAEKHAPELTAVLLDASQCRIEKYENKRVELLLQAASKPIVHVHQLDCQLGCKSSSGDDDSLTGSSTLELRNSGFDVIRIQVPVGVTQKDAASAVRKLLALIEGPGDDFKKKPEFSQAGLQFRSILDNNAAQVLGRAHKRAKKKGESMPDDVPF